MQKKSAVIADVNFVCKYYSKPTLCDLHYNVISMALKWRVPTMFCAFVTDEGFGGKKTYSLENRFGQYLNFVRKRL